MSLFTLFDNLFNRLPSVIKARSNKLETIRKWVACYFKNQQQRLTKGYSYV